MTPTEAAARLASFIPAHEDRVSITFTSILVFLTPMFICYYAMAVLVLTPSTRLHRLALLPPTLYALWNAGTRVDISNGIPKYNHNNYGYCVGCFTWKRAIREPINAYEPDRCIRNGDENHRMDLTRKFAGTLEKIFGQKRVQRCPRFVLHTARNQLALVSRIMHTSRNSPNTFEHGVRTRHYSLHVSRRFCMRCRPGNPSTHGTDDVRLPSRRDYLRCQPTSNPTISLLNLHHPPCRTRHILFAQHDVPLHHRPHLHTVTPRSSRLAPAQPCAVVFDVALRVLGPKVAPDLPSFVHPVRLQTCAGTVRKNRRYHGCIPPLGRHAQRVYMGHGPWVRLQANWRILHFERGWCHL